MAPPDWQIRSIEDVCLRVTSGGTPSRREPAYFQGGQWPWVKTQELRDGWLDDTEEHITDAAVRNSSANVLPTQTILLAMYGATVGQLGILRRPMTCNQACSALVVDEDQAHFRFVYYQLLHARDELKRLSTGAAQQNLSGTLIKSLRFPFPPLPEQRAIAEVLGALDDKIELNERMNATLDEMARALFKSWFVHFDPVRAKAEGSQPSHMDAATAALFPASFEDSALGPIPAGWRVSTVGEETSVFGGSTPSTKEPAFWDGEHAFATPKDLSQVASPILLDTARRITQAGLSRISSGLLPADTVLMSSRAPIGYLAIARLPVAVNQGIAAMVCDRDLEPPFILNWALTNLEEIQARGSGTTFAEISKSKFREIPCIVPSPQVHAAFHEKAAPLYDLMTTNVSESRTLAELRDALLPKLISGELRVSESV